jgi:hypothetical protein
MIGDDRRLILGASRRPQNCPPEFAQRLVPNDYTSHPLSSQCALMLNRNG